MITCTAVHYEHMKAIGWCDRPVGHAGAHAYTKYESNNIHPSKPYLLYEFGAAGEVFEPKYVSSADVNHLFDGIDHG